MQALSESSKKWGAADSPQPVDESSEVENQNNYKVRNLNISISFIISKIFLLKTGTSEDESSYSSFYSSFLKSDEGTTSSNEGRAENQNQLEWNKTKIPLTKRPDPSWLDNIDLTKELVYQYQVDAMILKDVLKADLSLLKKINQVSKLTSFH